jgi:branched-chain amino acid transport system ATP-binding protein
MLRVLGLRVGYGRAVALQGIDLEVRPGGLVAVLGPNGAGKTTLLRALTGLLPFSGGRLLAGTIELDGHRIERRSPASIVRLGVAQVLEGRRAFASLTVEENLATGAFSLARTAARDAVDRVLDTFPLLAERRRDTAGSLSGGQQQLLVMGRALVRSPKLLVLDEPTLGLSPTAVHMVTEVVAALPGAGMTVLLVEQRAAMALAIAESGVVLSEGEVVAAGSAHDLRDHAALRDAYLGTGSR